jgi:hypothetical protein
MRLTAAGWVMVRPGLWPQQALVAGVQVYRYLLKPWLGNACRFEPTCSAYALTALQGHGAWRGSLLAAWRVARCHPWCDGGYDPVPASRPPSTSPTRGLFTRLLACRTPGSARDPR